MTSTGRTVRWKAGLLSLCLAIATSAGGVLHAVPAAAKGGGAGLFEADDELRVVLEFPVKRLLRDRLEREELAGTLHYQDRDGR